MSNTKIDVAELISAIPVGRWFRIRRALDMTSEEIFDDHLAMLAIAVNETRRAETGKDDWTNVLECSITDLTNELGLSDDDDKSDD